MQDPVSLGSGIQGLLQFLGEIAFAWIPATVASIAGTGVEPNPPLAIITQPVSYGDFISYIQNAATPGAYDQLFHKWEIFVILSILVTLLLATFLVYCVIRLVQVREHEYRHFHALAHPIETHDIPRSQLRWQRILEEVSSDNPQKWRLAILEADIMLSELLDTLGYRGETMADKMRSVDRANFNTIDLAWDAHRVRNRIAHEGERMSLSDREARTTINNYQRVFQEFNFV